MNLEEIEVKLANQALLPYERQWYLHLALEYALLAEDALKWRYYKGLLEQLQQDALKKKKESE